MSDEFGAILPWQTANWRHLSRMLSSGSLPHALMLTGLEGTGMRQFARSFAQWLLCESPGSDSACSRCHSCALNRAGSHPDLLVLEAEQPGTAIKVDAVRQVIALGQETAQQGGYRVVILCPAEGLNLNAANALLKTLEEPGNRTLLVLVSFSPSAVLPTIRSRCQLLSMAAPQAADSRLWLQQRLQDPEALSLLHAFAPRQPLYALGLEAAVSDMRSAAAAVLRLIEGRADPLQVASNWMSMETEQLLRWIYQWLCAACLVAAAPERASEFSARLYDHWTRRAPLSALLAVLDQVLQLRRELMSGANPNRQMLLERVAFALCIPPRG